MKTKIAIACQGGGSQTAFTAGVLKVLFEHKVHEKFEVVSLSGTSGGAICAFFIWMALHKKEDDVSKRLMEFWHDNSAQTSQEIGHNNRLIDYIESVTKGHLPAFHTSPTKSIKMLKLCNSYGLRNEFLDLEVLLRKHISGDDLVGVEMIRKSPILVVGASNVLTGKLAKFSSFRQDVKVEHLLASACVPSIFPAVEINGMVYWDGLFADNPPISSLVKPNVVGAENKPDEFWIIKINPTNIDFIPEYSDDILDRQNELEGNNSLFQNLQHIQFLNNLYLDGAFTQEYLEQHKVSGPVKIPKLFPEDQDRPYHIPLIEMSAKIQKELNYESKFDRDPKHIQDLIKDGESQGLKFLKQRGII